MLLSPRALSGEGRPRPRLRGDFPALFAFFGETFSAEKRLRTHWRGTFCIKSVRRDPSVLCLDPLRVAPTRKNPGSAIGGSFCQRSRRHAYARHVLCSTRRFSVFCSDTLYPRDLFPPCRRDFFIFESGEDFLRFFFLPALLKFHLLSDPLPVPSPEICNFISKNIKNI